MKKLLLVLFVSFSLVISLNFKSIAEIGVSSNEILIGSSLVLTGPAQFLGQQLKLGYEAYIKKINDAGGINGKKIRTIFYDDGYESDKCVVNTKKLIEEDKVFVLTSYVGMPTTN
ncbi:MAG TPA: ABC transporter substrate-binding protein, partial [bacterium]|nr:ABC transporter substrate-binding protein [bacterium]